MSRVLDLGPRTAARVVLFAAGAGGDPQRYRPLLDHLAANDFRVIAPSFDRLDAVGATRDELVARPEGLIDALAAASPSSTSVSVVGHSIGAWAALCLAGAQPRQRDGTIIEVPTEPRVDRLVLYAPAAGWFWAPGALDAVQAPTRVYVGDSDLITPPDEAMLLTAARNVDVEIMPGVGHFTFMHDPPPANSEDVAIDRDKFFGALHQSTADFLRRGVTSRC